MRTNRNVAIIGFITTVIAVFIVSLLIVPPTDRSPHFWARIAWTDFLALLVWSHLSGLILWTAESKNLPRLAGVFRAYGFVAIAYAAVSFVLLIGFAWLDKTNSPNRIHMAIQVVLLALTVILSALMYLPAYFAGKGTAQESRGTVPSSSSRRPFELVSQLRSEEVKFAPPGNSVATTEGDRRMHQAIKALREKITYSLDGISRVKFDPEYGALVTRIESVCYSLSVIRGGSSTVGEPDATVRELQTLTDMVEGISNGVKRR